ncbi:MAG: sugar nucleotide-binding protein [Brevibacterium sp.]|uniref:sugar nucleotide-binding protein n=1 Tax=Brevibacterium sp. TaxID=1701 RepID=UPI003F928756
MSDLEVAETPIEGMHVLNLPVHGDDRGWFKENWQREKMVDLGLPDFGPVQQNMSFNQAVGVTRGIHTEPWDKLVSVGVGRVFGAWVDLRPGNGFGTVFTTEITPGTAVYVPRGVGNAFQTLEADTLYSYLVNDHWNAAAKSEYTFVNLADPELDIAWPISLDQATVSEADRTHPNLADVTPMAPRRTLVIGDTGQLARALHEAYVGDDSVEFLSRERLDLADPASIEALNLRGVDAVINAAAYTSVDSADTPEGRGQAWAVNATGVAHLARKAAEASATLVHVSSDYVFDGSKDGAYTEDDSLCPLGVYGQSKAAGDLAVSAVPRHYIVRTSWVIGAGSNFVATMASLAGKGFSPSVVDDQMGRLTSTATIAAAIRHLLDVRPAYGAYNVTGGGEPSTWCGIAQVVFERCGRSADDVSPVSTAEYAAGKSQAPRPTNSVLDNAKIAATGFVAEPHLSAIDAILSN